MSLFVKSDTVALRQLTGKTEDYPALSVRCKIDWIKNEYADPINRVGRAYAYPCLLYSTSQIVENPYQAQSKPVPDTKPAPELRPASSTNTFCVPEYYSDYEEATFLKSEAPFEKVEESSIECSEQQQAIPLADGIFSVKQELQAQTIEPEDTEVRASEPMASPKSAPQDSAEEVSEDDPEETSDSDPSSFQDESELESDGESALHSVTSVKNSIVDIDADSGEDLSYQPSESDAGSHETDSESVPDDSSDDESSAHGQGKCIDPSLLTQSVNLAITDAEKSLNDAWGIKSEMESNPKIETQGAERKESDSAASLAPRELEHEAPLQPYTTSAQFFPAHSFGTLSSTRVFHRDGPFSYDDSAQERASSAGPSSAEPILTPVSLPLKRKCSGLETQDAQLPQSNVLSSQKVNLKTMPQTQEAAKAINSALDEAEPLKKRAKSKHSSSSSSSTGLAGYTATAVVSALLGSVGTIALLAALPADYFQ